MDLILWRHAEAREACDAQDDLARALTGKGERQARRMSQWLQRHLVESARVLSSPALRCRQTAEALGRRFRVEPALAPDAGVEDLLSCVRWPHAREPVLVVGHQPTLGLAAARLLAGAAQPWAIRKGALWWLRVRKDAQGDAVVLVCAISPDTL